MAVSYDVRLFWLPGGALRRRKSISTKSIPDCRRRNYRSKIVSSSSSSSPQPIRFLPPLYFQIFFLSCAQLNENIFLNADFLGKTVCCARSGIRWFIRGISPSRGILSLSYLSSSVVSLFDLFLSRRRFVL